MQNFSPIHWPNSPQVRSIITQRHSGHSCPPFDSFNLSDQVGDMPEHVALNRKQLMADTGMKSMPLWLNQTTHSDQVVHTHHYHPTNPLDGLWTDQPDTVITILTADCLPILFYQPRTQCIAGCHAGWRGLAQNIIQKTLNELPDDPEHTLAWIGPGIGYDHYQVDAWVAEALYASIHSAPPSEKKQKINLKAIATQQLKQVNITQIMIDKRCTLTAQKELFSYRGAAHHQTGRFASCIWLAPQ